MKVHRVVAVLLTCTTAAKLHLHGQMKLWVLPEDGLSPLLKGIQRARISIDIMIFRFDLKDVERALARAVERGVAVRALVAHLNRAGEDGLRDLEMRLLALGVSVARTANELTRYHGKMMIVDRQELYVFAFNYTHSDTERSRSFGIVITNRKLVSDAVDLFESDSRRVPYMPKRPALLVSPTNARHQLGRFIQEAKQELLIYDPAVTDPAMIRLLEERARAGVDVKIIGRLARWNSQLQVHKLAQLRLHTRTMIRDGRDAFVGSQSLRASELDSRREIGVIFSDNRSVSRLLKTFHEDWQLADANKALRSDVPPLERVAKRVAKAVARDLPPLTPVLEEVIRKMGVDKSDIDLVPGEVEASVKDAVTDLVKEIVKDAVEGAAETKAETESNAT